MRAEIIRINVDERKIIPQKTQRLIGYPAIKVMFLKAFS